MPPRKKSKSNQQIDTRRNSVLAQLENAIDKINNVVTLCSETASQLAQEGKIEQMLAVINSPGYLSVVDAVKTFVQAAVQENDLPNENTQAQETTTTSSSRYDVLITAKNNSIMTPHQAYKQALKLVKIQASDWHNTDAKSVRFEMMCVEHANILEKTIREGTTQDGTKFSDHVEASIFITSAYAIKSVAIPADEFKKIMWAKGIEVELNTAMATLLENNHFWFRSPQDIENVDVHTNGADKYWVSIYCSKKSFDRFLAHPGSIRKVSMEEDMRPVIVYEQVRHDLCFNCLEICPGSNKCRGKAKCRFCSSFNHKSTDCTQKRHPVCFRCRVSPTAKEIEDIKRDLEHDEDISNPEIKSPLIVHAKNHKYDHDALSSKCNFIRERVNTVLAQKRAAAKNEYK